MYVEGGLGNNHSVGSPRNSSSAFAHIFVTSFTRPTPSLVVFSLLLGSPVVVWIELIRGKPATVGVGDVAASDKAVGGESGEGVAGSCGVKGGGSGE
jgi:hypothetical protein